MDTIAGAIDAGVRYLSIYTFSTGERKRSPAEVRFIMGYATDVLARRTAQLDEWGVHVLAGREPRLWKSVIHALGKAERTTHDNTTLDLVMCVNYGVGPRSPTPRVPSPATWRPVTSSPRASPSAPFATSTCQTSQTWT